MINLIGRICFSVYSCFSPSFNIWASLHLAVLSLNFGWLHNWDWDLIPREWPAAWTKMQEYLFAALPIAQAVLSRPSALFIGDSKLERKGAWGHPIRPLAVALKLNAVIREFCRDTTYLTLLMHHTSYTCMYMAILLHYCLYCSETCSRKTCRGMLCKSQNISGKLKR